MTANIYCFLSSFVSGWSFRLWRWNMTFSDTEMKELGRSTQINIHKQDRWSVPSSMSRTSCRQKKPSRWKKHARAHYHQVKSVHKGVHVFQISQKGPCSIIAENVMWKFLIRFFVNVSFLFFIVFWALLAICR